MDDVAWAGCAYGTRWRKEKIRHRVTFWVPGPKRAGGDRLYGEPVRVEIDEDVRVEYWTDIRKQPERVGETEASR